MRFELRSFNAYNVKNTITAKTMRQDVFRARILFGLARSVNRTLCGIVILVALIAISLSPRAFAAGLTIVPTFDTTITTDPQAATIEATINQAIAIYQAKFSDSITVKITFKEMTSGLGASDSFYRTVSYSTYRAALVSHATTPDDFIALAHLPNTSTNPVTGNVNMDINTALARALGLYSGTGTDGTVSLNTSLMNLSTTSTNPNKYSLLGTACHEIDEVLGTGTDVGVPAGSPWSPPDLFRYDGSGNRSFSTDTSALAFFSLDGATILQQYNQDGFGDYGDWVGSAIAHVQDAYATPGVTPVMGVELQVLDAIGYKRIPTVVANNNDSGAGSLRQALQNIDPSGTITFDTTFFATPKTIVLTSGVLSVANDMTVLGPGAALATVSGNNASQVFNVGNVTATLSGLTISAGKATNGGAIATGNQADLTCNACVFSNNTATSTGGAIAASTAFLTLNNCTFSSNSGPSGGAIFSQGNMAAGNTTFAGNSSTTAGGAIDQTGGVSGFTNCTFSGNAGPDVGGIRAGGGTVGIVSSTFANNTGIHGALTVIAGTTTIRSSIFSGTASQIVKSGGTLTSLGNNLCSDNSIPTPLGSDLTSANAVLGALGSYGGLVQTVPLLPGSPAIDAGAASAPLADARGVARVGGADIGAYESRAFTLAAGSGGNQATTVTRAFTNPLLVTVTGTSNDPVNGGMITFTPPASGAGLSPATSFTASISSGAASTGTITANGTAGGPYTVAASAAGAATGVAFSLTNNAAPTLSPLTLPGTQPGVVYTQSISASGGTGSLTVSLTNYNAGGTGLAAPTTSANTAAFNAAPAASGTVGFDLSATDAAGATVTQHYTVIVAAPPVVSAGPSDDVYQGQEAAQLFGSATAVSPSTSIANVAWTCTGAPGSSPANIQTNINTLNALIAGNNTSLTLTFATGTLAEGDYTLQLTATDNLGLYASASTPVRVYTFSEQHLTGISVTRSPSAALIAPPTASALTITAASTTSFSGSFGNVIGVEYRFSTSVNSGVLAVVQDWSTSNSTVIPAGLGAGHYQFYVEARIGTATNPNTLPDGQVPEVTAYAPDLTVGTGVTGVSLGTVTFGGNTVSFPINATVVGNPTVYYHVARNFNGGAYAVLNGWNWAAGVGSSINFSDSTLTANGVYKYQVEVSNLAAGPYTAYTFTNNITVGPAVTAVSIGAITVSGSTVSFPVNATATGSATIYYHVAQSFNGGPYNVLSAWNWVAGTASISFSDTTAATPGLYSYQVEASSSATGPYTAYLYTPNISVAPPVTAVAVGTASVSGSTISFTINSTVSANVTVFYRVSKTFNGGAYVVVNGWNWAPGAVSGVAFSDATASANGVYAYKIEASSVAGGPYQAYTFTKNITIGSSVTAVTVGAATVSGSTVSFPVNVTVNGAVTVYYHVAKSANGGAYTVIPGWNWLAGTGTSISFSDPTATVNGTYQYQVEASNSPTGPYTAYTFKTVSVTSN